MELYIGGSYQGKLDYVLEKKGIDRSAAADGKSSSLGACMHAPVINHFHVLIRRMLEKGMPAADIAGEILEKNAGVFIICDEIGCGIVPMEKEERIYREETGRILCMLAERAEAVERIVCGIPCKIK